ncbi:JAB1/Mov34/MPN/PAD-1 ubiquitin protease-domain-containing protein [Haematococcus lacustris]
MPAPRSREHPSLVRQLTAVVPPRAVQNSISIAKYYHSAELVLRQADSYEREGNEEQQYVMLMRFASLILETLPGHQDYKKADPKYVRLKKTLADKVFPQLEQLKIVLQTKDIHDPSAHSRNRPDYAIPAEGSRPALPASNGSGAGSPGLSSSSPGGGWPGKQQQQQQQQQQPAAYDYSQVQVDDLLDIIQHGPGPGRPGGGNAGLVLQQGHGGLSSLSSSSSSSSLRQGQSWHASHHTADSDLGLVVAGSGAGRTSSPPHYKPKYAAKSNDADRHALYYQSSGRLAPSSTATAITPAAAAAAGGRGELDWVSPGGYLTVTGSLPAARVPGGPGFNSHLQRYPDLAAFAQVPQPSAGPSPPPQLVEVVSLSSSQAAATESCSCPPAPGYPGPPPSSSSSSRPLPPPPPPSAVSALALPDSSGVREVSKRAQLRDVHVSVALMEEFLAYARANTSRGIESCGILAGQLSANDSMFTITTLIIPKQQGTSDTVQALNEEEIFEVQFAEELYPLGWIHTHPTQTCFLSSVDVHTQCGYQTMLDEAVAIVMAPSDRKQSRGIFRLSTPGGLQLVQRCSLRGFHAHPDTSTGQELYEKSSHVYLNPNTRHKVIDLR